MFNVCFFARLQVKWGSVMVGYCWPFHRKFVIPIQRKRYTISYSPSLWLPTHPSYPLSRHPSSIPILSLSHHRAYLNRLINKQNIAQTSTVPRRRRRRAKDKYIKQIDPSLHFYLYFIGYDHRWGDFPYPQYKYNIMDNFYCWSIYIQLGGTVIIGSVTSIWPHVRLLVGWLAGRFVIIWLWGELTFNAPIEALVLINDHNLIF